MYNESNELPQILDSILDLVTSKLDNLTSMTMFCHKQFWYIIINKLLWKNFNKNIILTRKAIRIGVTYLIL